MDGYGVRGVFGVFGLVDGEDVYYCVFGFGDDMVGEVVVGRD